MRHIKILFMWPEANNWQPTAAYAMKKDPASTKFWLELTGLTTPHVYVSVLGGRPIIL
jgi:hypothetical protein